MERLDWNDGKRKEENSVEKNSSLAAIFFTRFVSMRTSKKTVIFAGKAHLKIKLLVKTPLHKYRVVGRSG